MGVISVCVFLLLCGCATFPPAPATHRPFRFQADTFAFANETVFAYKDGAVVTDREIGRDPQAARYSRNCFVMARAAVQFWKYARFEPAAPAVEEAELVRRIQRVARLPVWGDPAPAAERIVFPGYADLRAFSAANVRMLQQHLGSGLATYFRIGNWSLSFPPNHRHQVETNARLEQWLTNGYPAVLWLCNFPKVNINHVVTAFDREVRDGKVRYRVYDPNYTDRPRVLEFDPVTQEFSYEPTFYFVGGRVGVRIIYQSPLM